MQDNRDEIKTQQLSNTAKLLAAYMAATGIFCAKTLADALDIPIRTIQRLKLDIATTEAPHAPLAPPVAHLSERNSATCATRGVFEAPEAPPVAPLARVEYNNITTTISNKVIDAPASVTRRGTRLPADWRLPNTWGQWTQINFAQATADQIRSEGEAFKDFWTAKPGASACKLDWQATWRNWCRNSKNLTGVPARKGSNSYNPNIDPPIKLNPNAILYAQPRSLVA